MWAKTQKAVEMNEGDGVVLCFCLKMVLPSRKLTAIAPENAGIASEVCFLLGPRLLPGANC